MHLNRMIQLESDHIRVSKSFVMKHQIVTNQMTIHLGSWRKDVQIHVDEHFPQDCIGIAYNVFPHFIVHAKQQVTVKVRATHLHIGPVIGLLASRTKLDYATLRRFQDYFMHPHTAEGIYFIFSVCGIVPDKQRIQGYLFRYDLAKQNIDPWVSSVLPYPDVLYRRAQVKHSQPYDDLASQLGPTKIFNAGFIDKWQWYKTMAAHPVICSHLPETVPLIEISKIEKMLVTYHAVYIKPYRGAKGKGIKYVRREKSGYRLQHRNRHQSQWLSRQDFVRMLHDLRRSGQFLVQQSVAYVWENRHIDFRVIMQKDKNKTWTCTGIIARFGYKHRFYTNDVRSVQLGRHTLRDIFQLAEDDVREIEHKIVSICKSACMQLENTHGHYGDIGVDIVMDARRRVWLLEMNFRHQANIANIWEDQKMYERVMAKPF